MHVYDINNVSIVGHFSSHNIWILFETIIKYLHWSIYKTIQIFISRYGCNGNTYVHVHHVDPMYVHKFTRLFIDHILYFYGHLTQSHIKPVCGWVVYNGRHVIWGRAVLVVRILPWTRFFVMFTCPVLLAAGLAAFKWNQAWHLSEVIGA